MRKLFVPIAAFAGIAMAFQAFSFSTAAGQESPVKPLMLITWFGPGGIPLPEGKNWKPEMLTVYDKGTRPVAQFSDNATRRSLSYIVFENLSGTPTAQGCRQDGIDPIVKNEGKLISGRVDGEVKNPAGETLATTFYVVDMSGGGGPGGIHQPNFFAFAGNAKTCAEIHISSVVNTPAEQDAEVRSRRLQARSRLPTRCGRLFPACFRPLRELARPGCAVLQIFSGCVARRFPEHPSAADSD